MERLVCVKDFGEAAKEILKEKEGVWEYFETGADEELALERNRSVFRKWIIRPRMLRDVSQRDMGMIVLGKRVQLPVGVAPMAVQTLAHSQGEVGMVRAASNSGSVFILSCMSSLSLEEVASGVPKGSRLWFQLILQKDREFNKELILRAEKAGFEALVISADTNVHGKRINAIKNPFLMDSSVKLGNFECTNGDGKVRTPERDERVSWDEIDRIKEICRLKVIVKGIMTKEDALLCAERNVDGIIVSNHGGRQLDSVLSPLEVLPEVMETLKESRTEVFMDGGIMQGSDVFKAVALGAKMVFIGRGILWGLAVGGEEGAKKVLDILREELDLTMALSGNSRLCGLHAKNDTRSPIVEFRP